MHFCIKFIRSLCLVGLIGTGLSATAVPFDTAAVPAPAPSVTTTQNSGNLIGSGADAVARFLQESGVLAAADGSGNSGQLMRQVRDTASDLVMSAMTFLGVPYRRGGTSVESGFDCSGFTRHVFENSVGLLLPRRSRDQANAPGLLDIPRDNLKPGDLVFFNTMRSAFSHVGIYVGEGKFIHSPRTGSEVRVENMTDSYWTKRFNGARRAPEVSATGGLASKLQNATLPRGGFGTEDAIKR